MYRERAAVASDREEENFGEGLAQEETTGRSLRQGVLPLLT